MRFYAKTPETLTSEAGGRLARDLRRLDPYSFWTLPAPFPGSAEMIVAGTTGIFLIGSCDLSGVLRLGRRPVVGDIAVPIHSLRVAAKKLDSRLSQGADFPGVEPVMVLTRAVAGQPSASGGIRFVRAIELVQDLTSRPRALSPERAAQAARLLGVELAGDSSRHFAIRRRAASPLE